MAMTGSLCVWRLLGEYERVPAPTPWCFRAPWRELGAVRIRVAILRWSRSEIGKAPTAAEEFLDTCPLARTIGSQRTTNRSALNDGGAVRFTAMAPRADAPN